MTPKATRTLQRLWPRLFLTATLVAATLFSAKPPPTVGAQSITDRRFGAVETYAAPTEATALGAGWTRVTFEWNRIQPNGPHEWNVVPISDQALADELAQGRQVTGLLITTPGWATDTAIGPGVPQGLYLPTNDPNNHWANFVRTIVGRYDGRIDHWTIWNEPEISLDSSDATWGGSLEDFIQLLRVAYVVAKGTNPDAAVHMSAVTHWHNDLWFGQFLDALVADADARANNYYFDIATLHLYHEPEKIYDITTLYYHEMYKRGIYKPIWLAETNAYLSRVTEDEQAFFIFQTFALEIAGGAERVAVYKMVDTKTDQTADPEPFGLARMDGSRRPAFKAYQVATTYLAGFRGGKWDRRDDISVVTIDRGQETTVVFWSRTPEPQTAMIPARTTRGLLVDTQGAAYYVYPERGYYFINLPGATSGMGGAPFMLVEEASVYASTAPTPAPSSQETPDPDSLPTPTPTFTPSPTTTPAPSPTSTPTPTSTPIPKPTHTPTSMPTPTPTRTPTPTPIPLPQSPFPPERSWLLIGVLALVLGGTAIAADRKKSA